MKFGHVEIFVNDTMKSKDFYEKVLGFKVIEVQHKTFVWMKSGNQEFLLRPGKKNLKTSIYKDSDIGFVFYTEDLEQTKNELLSIGLEFKGIDGSDSCLTFTDLDGNWFQLVNPKHN